MISDEIAVILRQDLFAAYILIRHKKSPEIFIIIL